MSLTPTGSITYIPGDTESAPGLRIVSRSFARIRLVLLVIATSFVFASSLSAQGIEALRQLNGSVEELVRRVSPSVVQVIVTRLGSLEDGGESDSGIVIEKQRSLGSGAIIDPDGYIITNAHVVKDAQRVQVMIPSVLADLSPIRSLNSRGRSLDARIVGIAEEVDLALLHVEAHGLPALPIGNYDKVRQGAVVLAFGSPQGLQGSVTMGLVSAVARQPDPDSHMIFIQTDAPINPGNSGGPLVDVDGTLVGINTFILSQSGGNEGLGFAIPSAVVAFAYPQLRKFGHVHRGEIGLLVQAISPQLTAALNLPKIAGVIVADVLPGSPAESAGLKVEDIVVSVDGRPVDSVPLFSYGLFIHGPGEHVKLNVIRGKEKLAVDVPVVERDRDLDRLQDSVDPQKNIVQRLGIVGIEIDTKIAELLPGLRETSGVIVAARTFNAGSGGDSLATGDVIHSVNGTPITSLEGLRSALDTLKKEAPIALHIERNGQLFFVSVASE